MEYEVITDFFDKHLGSFHPLGSLYETGDEERAKELQNKGFLKAVEQSQFKEELPSLDSAVEKVKKFITTDLDIDQLKVLLKLEIEGKNRKTIVEHIEHLLKEVE